MLSITHIGRSVAPRKSGILSNHSFSTSPCKQIYNLQQVIEITIRNEYVTILCVYQARLKFTTTKIQHKNCLQTKIKVTMKFCLKQRIETKPIVSGRDREEGRLLSETNSTKTSCIIIKLIKKRTKVWKRRRMVMILIMSLIMIPRPPKSLLKMKINKPQCLF